MDGGVFQLFQIAPDGLLIPGPCAQNLRLYSWGTIAAQCIGLGKPEYRVSGMYIEYENTTDPVTVPAYGRESGLDYYANLDSVPNRDYLRVPLLQDPKVDIAANYDDYFASAALGNQITCVAQSAGTEGVHGKPWSAAANSKIIGLALVAMPVFEDPTRDIIFARAYYSTDKQMPKQASGQVLVTHQARFG